MDIVQLILAELQRAEKLHPSWPSDVVHSTAIVVEEAGEAMRAALQCHYDGEPLDDLRTELVQTGAMAIRALLHLKGK